MRYIYPKYGIDFSCSDGKMVVLTVESPHILRELTIDIWRQIEGNEGGWSIMNGEMPVNPSKGSEVIFNPFDVNINDKKIITQLQKDIIRDYDSEYYLQVSNIQTQIVSLMDSLGERLPYPLSYDENIGLEFLVKNVGLAIDLEYDNEIEHLLDYICLKSKICHVGLFFLINPGLFFENSEISQLFQKCIYENINIVVLEQVCSLKTEYETHFIFDKDLCLIEI